VNEREVGGVRYEHETDDDGKGGDLREEIVSLS